MQAGEDEVELMPGDGSGEVRTQKRIGGIGGLSGADIGDVYAEVKKAKDNANRHPLFKRFKGFGR